MADGRWRTLTLPVLRPTPVVGVRPGLSGQPFPSPRRSEWSGTPDLTMPGKRRALHLPAGRIGGL